MAQTHAAQDVGALGELDGGIFDNLQMIAPGVEKVEPVGEGAFEDFAAEPLDRFADRLTIIDHHAEVALGIGLLAAAGTQGDELVAEVDKSHRLFLAPQFEFEQLPVEFQGLVNIADFEGNMVDADGDRFVCLICHG